MVPGFRHGSSYALSLARYQVPKHRCCFLRSRLPQCRRHPRVLSLLSVKELHCLTRSYIPSIGPVDLTEGTVGGNTSVPTLTDSLYRQGTIDTESIGIFYQPSTLAGTIANGELTFGGIDSSRYTLIFVYSVSHGAERGHKRIVSDVNYVPITSQSPASRYWGIDQDITYGSNGETILNLTAGIVDTGSTLILLATGSILSITLHKHRSPCLLPPQTHSRSTNGLLGQLSTGSFCRIRLGASEATTTYPTLSSVF
jgi:hypothetical protein